MDFLTDLMTLIDTLNETDPRHLFNDTPNTHD